MTSDGAAGRASRPSATHHRGAALGAALLAGLLAAGDARAVSVDEFRARSARELLALCSDEAPGEGDLTFCYGYITGAGDLDRALVRAGAIKPMACGGSDVTLDQNPGGLQRLGPDQPRQAGRPGDRRPGRAPDAAALPHPLTPARVAGRLVERVRLKAADPGAVSVLGVAPAWPRPPRPPPSAG